MFNHQSLDSHREEFSNRRFLSMPISGLLVWLVIGWSGIYLPDNVTVWVLFIGTGSIFYLAMVIARITGETFLRTGSVTNEFDRLFLFSVAQALLIYTLAIPFFLLEYTSLPLTVGILTGTMWIPFSWIIRHWVGIFHGVVRALLVLVLWYCFPENRFTAIPFAIAGIYLVTLWVLSKRN